MLWFCDNEFNHLGAGECLTPQDWIYIEAKMTAGREDSPFVLVDICVILAGTLARVVLREDHQGLDGRRYYRGESSQAILAYDLNGRGTYIRAQGYYIHNCAASTRLVGVGVPLERLRLKIENPPSWARFPYLGPDYVGPSIMFKGRIDGCDAYRTMRFAGGLISITSGSRNGSMNRCGK